MTSGGDSAKRVLRLAFHPVLDYLCVSTSLIGIVDPIERRPDRAGRFFVDAGTVRAKTPFEEKLLAMVEPTARGLGLNVVRVRVFGGSRRKHLQIMAEHPDGTMTVDDCADLSRALSALLDVEDPFEGEWELEVSSPGIDRPLTELVHFDRWRGYDARIELDRMVGGRKRYSGVIGGVAGDTVLLDLKTGEGAAELPFAWIADAKLILTDALIEESLKRRPPEAVAEPPEEPKST